jgi:hypothetical protein
MMELVDLYAFRMRLIAKALDEHKDETRTALSALGRIHTIINLPNAEVHDLYTTYRRESEPDWRPPADMPVDSGK